jgi:hypothetical protein
MTTTAKEKEGEDEVKVRVFTSDSKELSSASMKKGYFTNYAKNCGATYVENDDTLFIVASDGVALYFPINMVGRTMTIRVYNYAKNFPADAPIGQDILYDIFHTRPRGTKTLEQIHKLLGPHERKNAKGIA